MTDRTTTDEELDQYLWNLTCERIDLAMWIGIAVIILAWALGTLL